MMESWIKYKFSKKTDFFYFSAGLLLGIVLLATFYNTPTLYFETVNGDSIFGQANQVRFYNKQGCSNWVEIQIQDEFKVESTELTV